MLVLMTRFVHGGWRNIPPADRGKLAEPDRIRGWRKWLPWNWYRPADHWTNWFIRS
jgi:hypothetical protein